MNSTFVMIGILMKSNLNETFSLNALISINREGL